jgi:hypothetical protein
MIQLRLFKVNPSFLDEHSPLSGLHASVSLMVSFLVLSVRVTRVLTSRQMSPPLPKGNCQQKKAVRITMKIIAAPSLLYSTKTYASREAIEN